MPGSVGGTRTAAMWNAFGNALQPLLRAADAAGVPGKAARPRIVLPRPHTPHAPTPLEEVDAMLQRLDSRKLAWVHVDTRSRAELLGECLERLMRLAPRLARAGTEAKGSYEGGDGDEMATFLPVVTGLVEYREAMLAGGVLPPLALRRRRCDRDGLFDGGAGAGAGEGAPAGDGDGGDTGADGEAPPDAARYQYVATVWPRGMVPAFFPGFTGELWLEPGAEPTQGALYRRKRAGDAGQGGVMVVLGAGNQLPVVALDLLHALVAEDLVVLVKMNPVNDYYGPLLREVFAPLADRGFLEFCYGGADVGAHCTRHALVGAVHLTGSEATYNAVVFGSPRTPPAPGAAPTLRKPVTAELGNVTPYIVVPGAWSDDDLTYHATSVASGLAQNAGHNCIAAELIITDAAWPQRGAFLDAVARCLDALARRGPWYPGSAARLAAFRARFPDAAELGRPVPAQGQPEGHVPAEPWLLATGLSPEQAQARHENWGGVLQEVALPGCAGPADFLRRAVAYANDRCWGSLCVSLFIHPDTRAAVGGAYADALAALRYGAITVNCPALVAFSATPLSWGAFPGATPHDIGSGVGVVHNTYLFDRPQKSVVTAPWRYSPQPLWSVGQAGLAAALPWAFRYLASQDRPASALAFLCVVAVHALRGSWAPAREGGGGKAGGKAK